MDGGTGGCMVDGQPFRPIQKNMDSCGEDAPHPSLSLLKIFNGK